MNRFYTVEGRWPFPTGMLRHDQAQPASASDRALIEKFAADTIPEFLPHTKIRVTLVMQSGEATQAMPRGRLVPNQKRWESFGWSVIGDPDVTAIQTAEKSGTDFEARRQAALAKLTPEDIDVLGLSREH